MNQRRCTEPTTPAPRVTLRTVNAENATAIQPWFEAAWRDSFGPRSQTSALTAPSADAWLATVAPDAEPLLVTVHDQIIGIVACDRSAGLTISALAIDPARRNLGYGAEAVYALEERVADNVRQSRALVPRTNGLAIYFWLRVGYRPTFASQHTALGYTVMRRDLGESAGRRSEPPEARRIVR